MDKSDILAMVAGCELDNLIQSKVMQEPYDKYFHPSINIGDAWQVVDKMNTNGMPIILEHGGIGGKYIVQYCNKDSVGTVGLVVAETAPEAICKSSLLAVMEV